MSRMELLRQMISMLPLYIGESIFSCLYVARFLTDKYERRRLLLLWCLPSVILDETLFALIPNIDPWHDPLWIAARLAMLSFLQYALFNGRERGMHLFLTASIISVVYLTKYLITMPYVYISDFTWGRLMPYLLNHGYLDSILTSVETTDLAIFSINFIYFFVNGLWGSFCTYFMLHHLEKAFTYKQDTLEKTDAIFLCIPCITSVVICLAFRVILRRDQSDGNLLFYNDIPYMRVVIMLICVLLLITIYVAIVLLQQQLLRRDEAKIAAMQEAHITQLSHEIDDLNNIYADLRLLRHNLNNHIENLNALLVNDASTNDIQAYLQRMRETTTDRLNLPFSTGHPVSDIILHRKAAAAEASGVRFESDFTYPDTPQVNAYDLGVILDNALDNAIEAASDERLPDNSRYVHLRSYQRGNLLFLEIINGFAGHICIDEKTGLPATTKADAASHGLGLLSIRRIAERYYGSTIAEVSSEGAANVFTLTVMLRLAP